MALNRYINLEGSEIAVNSYIYKAVVDGSLQFEEMTTVEGDRLDLIAHKYYSNANYWWVIASASGIGWWLQVPSGVDLKIPLSIEQVEKVIERIR